MDSDNVLYIHVQPYTNTIPIHILCERYYNRNNNNIKESYNRFYLKINNYMNKYNISHLTNKHINHTLNTNYIQEQLEIFFSQKDNKYTLKKNNTKKNGTQKH